MNLQCDCRKFTAELKTFPNDTPGRLKCYCDDCQIYLHYLGRAELLDQNAGSEIIPTYPCNMKILSGQEQVKCVRLTDKGMFRFYAGCCKTPIGNTTPGSPWIGVLRRMYTVKGSQQLDGAFPEVRASILGRYAKGTPPAGTPDGFNLSGFVAVMPFMLKGKMFGKFKPSPFFADDGKTPITTPHVMSSEELQKAKDAAKV